MECLDTYVDVDLLSKTIISIMGDKHHRHPVIAGDTRNLFRATATYKLHNFLFLLSHRYRAGKCLPRATKNTYGLIGEKRDATFHLMAVELFFWK
jgi:hypothetical protein